MGSEQCAAADSRENEIAAICAQTPPLSGGEMRMTPSPRTKSMGIVLLVVCKESMKRDSASGQASYFETPMPVLSLTHR